MKRMITRNNREKLEELLPGLNDVSSCNCKKEHHWKFFRLLAFSAYRDPVTGAVRIGQEALARCQDKLSSLAANNYSAKPFLMHCLNKVLPGIATIVLDEQGRDWSVSTWETVEELGNVSVKTASGMQRRAIVTWPVEVQDIINAELSSNTEEELVYIDTGLSKSAKREREELKRDREDADENVMALAKSPRAIAMANYLNNLPTNKFTATLSNFDAAQKVVESIDNPNTKLTQQIILQSIKERPMPLYIPTERSDRLYTTGPSLQNLKKSVRKALTADWYEADLQSSQLAIVAKLWNIPEVTEFLASGKSIWDSYLNHFGLVKEKIDYDAFKKTIKDHTYGLVFGMGKKRLTKELTEDLSVVNTDLSAEMEVYGIKNGGEKFLEHPLVKAIVNARKKRIKDLVHAGVYTVIEDSSDPYNPPIVRTIQVTRQNVLSILAQEAQRLEQCLIYPIFELTNQTDEFTITCLQHDGVSVSFSREDRREFWMNKISEAVNKMAAYLGVYTKLIWEYNSSPVTTTETSKINPTTPQIKIEVVKFNEVPQKTPNGVSITKELLCVTS